MANKRIRKKWLSRMRKDARRIAKRFKISRQEVGFALSGTIVESDIRYENSAGLTMVRSMPNHAVGYNVRLFGAVGDSVIDDMAAIQAAVNFAYGKSPLAPTKTVDGSIAELITDEKRLLK